MPHKYYHGKTGRVFNVAPRAVGIIINKRVNTRIVPKRIHVRVEHISHSKCRQDFINRVKKNETLKREARKEKSNQSSNARLFQPTFYSDCTFRLLARSRALCARRDSAERCAETPTEATGARIPGLCEEDRSADDSPARARGLGKNDSRVTTATHAVLVVVLNSSSEARLANFEMTCEIDKKKRTTQINLCLSTQSTRFDLDRETNLVETFNLGRRTQQSHRKCSIPAFTQ